MLAVLILGLALIACGSGESEETTTTAGATTTTGPTTTAPIPIYVVDDPSLSPVVPTAESDGAGGSGCPEDGGPPTDGIWYGYVIAVGSDSVTFELACFYIGDRAVEEAAEDGAEAPNDFYIRKTGEVSEVPMADDATAYTVVAPPNAELTVEAVTYSEWPQDPIGYTPCPGEFCSVWLYINNGVATELLEQYLP
jgi:hypothetical protein